jgi:hypothetical protein
MQETNVLNVLKLVAGSCVLTMLLACPAGGPKDARAAWKNGISKCAKNDLVGKNVLFFGPSNVLGPGTIFQNFTSGGTQVSHLVTEYESNSNSIMAPAGTFTCSAEDAQTFKLAPELSMELLIGASGTLGVDLKRASTVKVAAQSLQWDQLITGPYRQKILGLQAPADTVRNDLLTGGHLVLSRALKVKGMTAELEFTSEVGTELKAKRSSRRKHFRRLECRLDGKYEAYLNC